MSTAALRAAEAALEPYRPGQDGPFGPVEAGHLLRRTSFGGTLGERQQIEAWGPRRAVEELTSFPTPAPEYVQTLSLLQTLASTDSLIVAQAIWVTRMLLDPRPFRERLALFWHGHFATSVAKVGRVHRMVRQIETLRELGPGPLSELVAAVSRDPAMIVWLDGNANRRHHPNENFARELMELFTLGEGHYSERDVLEAARAFTGWHQRAGRYRFVPGEHDDGAKHVLGRSGNLGGDDVVSACLASPACGRHVGGRLFRFFVHTTPSAELLEVLGNRYRADGYDTLAFVRLLLGSREFFSARSLRAIVKSPTMLAVGAARSLGLHPDTQALAAALEQLGQSLYAPPSVKGWDGHHAWLNAATLAGRVNLAAGLANGFDATRLEAAPVDRLVDLLLDGQLPGAVRSKLEEHFAATGDALGVLRTMLSLPEYQLS